MQVNAFQWRPLQLNLTRAPLDRCRVGGLAQALEMHFYSSSRTGWGLSFKTPYFKNSAQFLLVCLTHLCDPLTDPQCDRCEGSGGGGWGFWRSCCGWNGVVVGLW